MYKMLSPEGVKHPRVNACYLPYSSSIYASTIIYSFHLWTISLGKYFLTSRISIKQIEC